MTYDPTANSHGSWKLAIDELRKRVEAKPKRIQRKRIKGWRMPKGAIYVGRPTVFGNPVVCTPHGCELKPCECCKPFRCCVKVYREYVMSGIESRGSCTGSFAIALDGICGYPNRNELVKRLPELRGKDLVCWCPLDKPCHADVLLELANKPPVQEGMDV